MTTLRLQYSARRSPLAIRISDARMSKVCACGGAKPRAHLVCRKCLAATQPQTVAELHHLDELRRVKAAQVILILAAERNRKA